MKQKVIISVAFVMGFLAWFALDSYAEAGTVSEAQDVAAYQPFLSSRDEMTSMANRGLPSCEALLAQNNGQVINSTTVTATFYNGVAQPTARIKSSVQILKICNAAVNKLSELEAVLP